MDIDSLLHRVYGKKKQGARFGHTKVGGYPVRLRGLSPLVATLSTPIAAPVIAAMRLRSGSAGSGRGAAGLLTQALATAKAAGASGRLWVRADSAYHAGAVVTAACKAGDWFSIAVVNNPAIRAAIATIDDDDAWTPVRYPEASRIPTPARRSRLS
ncbi:transposase [Saccharopolyspora pogona]|uniref:transposase n=1 Tax=Saccharopolyspora pogona TaxID=333966 RepID=UPI00168A0684|nr:transposase [Saccharopolyspora pogona]